MSKYTPRHTYDDFWEVEGLEDSHYLSGAEANIIAFALNAVADGLVLFADDVLFKQPSRVYDGPTDGVAPNANQ
jgi:hypothetical protein